MRASGLDELCINTMRFFAVDTVQRANSGHPGTPMGAAPMAYALWDRFLKHNPLDPDWPDRDRFILSPGHASAMLYAPSAPDRIRASSGGDQAVQAMGQQDTRPPGVRAYTRSRGDNRAPGPGIRQRGGDGHRGTVAG